MTVFGLRIAPLRFENDKGYLSVLETGFGLVPYKGQRLEVSIFTVVGPAGWIGLTRLLNLLDGCACPLAKATRTRFPLQSLTRNPARQQHINVLGAQG